MISNAFDPLWAYATRHGSIQQERSELEHVYNLVRDFDTYLEVGTAEGASLSVMASWAKLSVSIDIREQHTSAQLQEVLTHASNPIKCIDGNSHDPRVIEEAKKLAPYDVVFIDAGHSYEDAKQDAIHYGAMAKHYIIFHDIQLPPVKKAFNEYCEDYKNVSRFINSVNFGMGIIKCTP